MDTPAADLPQRLAALIAHELPQAHDITITGLRRVGGGMSTENWLFDAAWLQDGGPVNEPLVLRCAAANEIVATTREDEYHLLRSLAGRGLPVPRAFWLDHAGRWIGRPAMVLQRCPGRAERRPLDARNALGLDLAARVDLARQMTDALAAIHGLDAGGVIPIPGATAGERPPALRELERQESAIARDGLGDEPELVLAVAWLRAHLPAPPAREVLVHGDFRPANILVAQGRLSAVLDWELAHRGDPAEDLGWYLARIYRGEHFIRDAWSPQDFLARYERQTGRQVDAQAVRYWSVFAVFKLLVIAFNAMRAQAHGDHARVGPFPDRLAGLLMQSLGDDTPAGQVRS